VLIVTNLTEMSGFEVYCGSTLPDISRAGSEIVRSLEPSEFGMRCNREFNDLIFCPIIYLNELVIDGLIDRSDVL